MVVVLAVFRSPGVYLEDVASPPSPVLETGVPVFLGLRPLSPSTALKSFAESLGISGLFSTTPQSVSIDATTFATLDAAFGTAWAGGVLGFSLRGFFENGGRRCYVVQYNVVALDAALETLKSLDDFDVICAPDAADTPSHRKVLTLCEARPGCFALLDAHGTRRPDLIDPQVMLQYVSNGAFSLYLDHAPSLGDARANGALYSPWIKVAGACPGDNANPGCTGATCPVCGGTRQGYIPPSGHIAGVLARLDHQFGVHRAPANEPLQGAFDLQLAPNDATLASLRNWGVNWIHSLPGRGIRPWGARTLVPNHAVFSHVNMRRTYLTIARWLERFAADLTFEPNDMRLWLRIQRQVSAFLDGLYRQGALYGATAREAYFVKCDAETNPPARREEGTMVAEVGLSLARPTEFFVLRLLIGSGNAAASGEGSVVVSGR